MNGHRLGAHLALLLRTLAQAASVATPVVTCKVEADLKKVFRIHFEKSARVLLMAHRRHSGGLIEFPLPTVSRSAAQSSG